MTEDQSTELKEKYDDVKNEIAEFVKNNPWAALAIAAGFGYLIARLLHGRRD